MRPSLRLLVTLLTGLIVLGGCSRRIRHEFTDRSADQVWTAMRTVAESPIYDDWTVVDNDVWESPEQDRLEIFRRMHQYQVNASTRPTSRLVREYRIEVLLDRGDPPTATFRIRQGAKSPSWTDEEADRFYAGVTDVLAGFPAPPPPAADEEPEVEGVEIEDLEPDEPSTQPGG